MPSRYSEFIAGVKAVTPLLIGAVPFGLIYGVLALDAGILPTQAQAMSAIVFAGSSQFILTQLLRTEVSAWVMVLTVGVVNLRHALYSLSLAPYIQRLSNTWKWLLGYLLTDEAFAVTILYYQRINYPIVESYQGDKLDLGTQSMIAHDYRHWFFLGSGLALWSSWQLSTAVGIFLGAVVPDSWSLDFTLALTFISLVVSNIKDKAALSAALSAGLVAILAYAMPYRLGLMVAALTGIVVGLMAERRR